jgi:hypothetical protein
MEEHRVAMVDNNQVMVVDLMEANNNVEDMVVVTKVVNKQAMD